jgi:hypothetical protein
MGSRRIDYIRGRSYVPDLWERERVRKIIAEIREKLKGSNESSDDNSKR